MSRRNYTQYSNKNRQDRETEPVVPVTSIEEFKMESEQVVPAIDTVVTPVEETVETITLPKTVKGVVTNCSKLNVRAEAKAGADVVCVLNAMSEIEIDVDKSTAEWFHVCTVTGVEGYCMKKFVDARL